MSKSILTIGPSDHGRHMALEDFEDAEAQEGQIYELGRGVVAVTEVPHPRHFAQVDEIRQQLAVYRAANRGRIRRVAGGSDCKILVAGLDSERHPDVAVYVDPQPSGDDIWSRWIPAIVVEVVSPSSVRRDYEEKPEEYLRFGVREYWIVDAQKRQATILTRARGCWHETVVPENEGYTTGVLPGFRLDLARVFQAADEEPES